MEAEFYRWLRAHVPPHHGLPLGLRDDAAVLSHVASNDIVVTTDLLSDGVDFRLAEIEPERVGRKALAVSLSDLAAMAARPLAAVVAIALPRDGSESQTPLDLAIRLYEGLLPLAVEFDVAIAGGDTNVHDGPLVISVTALGQPTDRGPLTRGGGLPGDLLLITGQLGGSMLGHHLDFTPRVREALALRERYELHAGIDISDGLTLDLSRLAEESGCGAAIQLNRLPISAAALELPDSLEHALGDGEDFELLVAVPPDAARAIIDDQPLDCPVTCIGRLIEEQGLYHELAHGSRQSLKPRGWLH